MNIFTKYIIDFKQLAQNNINFQEILSNFVGGLILVLFLFICKEIFRPKLNLTGEWNVENIVLDTTYNPYKGLKVIWKLHILQSENTISGSGEKIKDINSDNTETIYTPSNRDTVELQGYIEKNYLRKDRIFINVIQVGQIRRSRATYTLKRTKNGILTGSFISTAADTKGTTIFSRNA